jgi:hypothetical protein
VNHKHKNRYDTAPLICHERHSRRYKGKDVIINLSQAATHSPEKATVAKVVEPKIMAMVRLQ